MKSLMRMLICAAAICSLAGCAEPQRRTAPEETHEAAGMSTDAGARAPNEPGGASMRTPDAGTDLLGADAGDGGASDR
jgi:hypothetical protein